MPSNDPNQIQQCIDLVQSGLWQEFNDGSKAIIPDHPDKMCSYGLVELWAQHMGEGKLRKDLLMPEVQRWLLRYAQNGIGPSEIYNNIIIFKFTGTKTSGTTTPISDLRNFL